MPKLSELPVAPSVDVNTLLVGLKTTGGTSTDYQFTIADLLAYLNVGASPVKANADVAGAAASALVCSFLAPADGTYKIGGYLNILALSGSVLDVQVSWTDENNLPQTAYVQCMNTASAFSTALNTTGFYSYVDYTVRVKAATTISVNITKTGGTTTFDYGATISIVI